MSTADHIRVAIEPALAPLGLVVEDVSVTPAGRRRVVRVLVDSDISGIDDADTSTPVPPLSLDTVADATRAVSDVLDETDLVNGGAYTLEVSSPGVGRPLTTRDQLRRQVGRLVEVVHGDATVTGRLVAVATDALTLEVPPTKKAPARTESVDLDTLHRATVQVEFAKTGPTDAADDNDRGAASDDADTTQEES